MSHAIARSLALAALLAIPAFGHAQDNQTPPQPTQAQPAADGTPFERWPVFVQRFWTERADETLSINGQMWSVRVKQAGEKQSEIAKRFEAAGGKSGGNTPSPAELAQAYQADDAPLYIRLNDGATAKSVEAAAGMATGLETITGKPGSVKGKWANFRANKRNYLLADVPDDVRSRFVDSKAVVTLVVRPGKEVEQSNPYGVKSLVRSFHIVPVQSQQPTPQELRAWCQTNKVTKFPDPRPVAQAHDKKSKTTGTPKTNWESVIVVERTYTYTWSNHTVTVPPPAR